MGAATTSVDGYPLRRTDPDFAIQEMLNRTLDNCRAVQPLFPTMGQLYPEVLKIQDRAPLLSPALKRLDWNLRENPNGEQWAAFFGPMINRIFDSVDSATEEQLFFLCEYAEFLKAHHCHFIADKIAAYGWKLRKNGALSAVGLDQLRKARRALEKSGTSATALFQLAWAILRAETREDDLSWSAAVCRDLRSTPKKLSAAWFALLDANDHAFHVSTVLPKPAAKLLAAFDPKEFEAGLARWTQVLADADPLHVSTACLTLLNYLLRLCHALPKAQVDESLYRVANAKWKRADPAVWAWPDPLCWLPAYLMVLPTRPAGSAFACVEALMMNPSTKTYADVERLYRGMLSASATASAPRTEVVTGIDGFRMEPGHPQAKEHSLIDQFLRASHPDEYLHGGGARTHGMDGLSPLRNSLVQQCESNLPNLVLALSERVTWLAAHAKELSDNTTLFWRVETGKLMLNALAKAADPELQVLTAALRSDSLGFFGVSPGGRILELCQRHVEAHGWSPEFLTALRAWIKTLHGTTSAQDLRRKAGWFVWFEDLEPIKPGECWSNLVRASLRSMSAPERKLWMPVVTNVSFAVSDKPSAKWMKPAKAAFEKLGADKFRVRFREWFQPFHESEPLRLTVPGRDMLRLLIWYAMVAADPAVDEALAWFSQAKWKTKESADRAAKADTAFAYVMAQRNPQGARESFERMIQSGRAVQGTKTEAAYRKLSEQAGTPVVEARPSEKKGVDLDALKAKHASRMKQMLLQQLGEGCSWDGDALVVKTGGETYRIDSITGRILRESDEAVVRVEIPYDAIPYKFFRAQVDGHDLRNPGEPNLMRTMMCAMVIRGGPNGPGRIVTDTI